MLVGDGFVVASPTKTGTQSLVALARSNPDLGLRYIPSGHGMSVPPDYAGFERHLIVRDPYARLLSIYGHLRRQARLGAEAMGFAKWLHHFLDLRRAFDPQSYDGDVPSIWLATQAECWRRLGGSRFWKLEEIGKFLSAVGIAAELPRVNVSRERAGTWEAVGAGTLDRVWQEWSRADCEAFGYERHA